MTYASEFGLASNRWKATPHSTARAETSTRAWSRENRMLRGARVQQGGRLVASKLCVSCQKKC